MKYYKLNVAVRDVITELLHLIPMLSASIYSLWGLQSNTTYFSCISLATQLLGHIFGIFLLNDQDKACFFHSTIWMFSYHWPISFFSLHRMRPIVVLPPHCKEQIYWCHQFLNSYKNSKRITWYQIYIINLKDEFIDDINF